MCIYIKFTEHIIGWASYRRTTDSNAIHYSEQTEPLFLQQSVEIKKNFFVEFTLCMCLRTVFHNNSLRVDAHSAVHSIQVQYY